MLKKEQQSYHEKKAAEKSDGAQSPYTAYRIVLSADYRGSSSARVDDTDLTIHIRNLLRSSRLPPSSMVPLCGMLLGVMTRIRSSYSCGIVPPKNGMVIGYDVSSYRCVVAMELKTWKVDTLRLKNLLLSDHDPGEFGINIFLTAEPVQGNHDIVVTSKAIKRVYCPMHGEKKMSLILGKK